MSVVMPVREASDALARTVAAVQAQGGLVDEVLIALGPSRDATREVAEQLAADDARIRVLENPSGTTPDGLNVALGAAHGDVLVRVDAKAHLPEGYVRTALDTLRRTGAANVGGMQVPHAERGFARMVAAAMRSPLGSGGARYRHGASAGPSDTVYLGVFRREALAAVGGFDPEFLRNQDAELNERLRAAGYTVWLEPSLAVRYAPRSTVRSLARQYLEYGRWRRKTARRHRGSLRARQLAAPLLVVVLALSGGASLVMGSLAPVALVVAGYVAGLLVGAARAATSMSDAPGVALALATMHLSWGVGFLLGPPRQGRTVAARFQPRS